LLALKACLILLPPVDLTSPCLVLHVLVNYLGALVFLGFGARDPALFLSDGSGRLVLTVVA